MSGYKASAKLKLRVAQWFLLFIPVVLYIDAGALELYWTVRDDLAPRSEPELLIPVSLSFIIGTVGYILLIRFESFCGLVQWILGRRALYRLFLAVTISGLVALISLSGSSTVKAIQLVTFLALVLFLTNLEISSETLTWIVVGFVIWPGIHLLSIFDSVSFTTDGYLFINRIYDYAFIFNYQLYSPFSLTAEKYSICFFLLCYLLNSEYVNAKHLFFLVLCGLFINLIAATWSGQRMVAVWILLGLIYCIGFFMIKKKNIKRNIVVLLVALVSNTVLHNEIGQPPINRLVQSGVDMLTMTSDGAASAEVLRRNPRAAKLDQAKNKISEITVLEGDGGNYGSWHSVIGILFGYGYLVFGLFCLALVLVFIVSFPSSRADIEAIFAFWLFIIGFGVSNTFNISMFMTELIIVFLTSLIILGNKISSAEELG